MKEKAKKILEEIYEKYHSQGLEAIYLWGSVITHDFNPETSDVDSIGIVEDFADSKIEDEIKKYLAATYPEIHKFGFRLLYKSELNGGPSRAFLSSVITPQLLLLDLPCWELAAGNPFTQKDFKLSVPSFGDAIKLHVESLHKFQWTVVKDIPENRQGQFLKEVARIIDVQQKMQGIEYPFSYSNILENSKEGVDRDITEALIECKRSKWDSSVFKKYVTLFQEYVDSLGR